jgi:hypothetical protein
MLMVFVDVPRGGFGIIGTFEKVNGARNLGHDGNAQLSSPVSVVLLL